MNALASLLVLASMSTAAEEPVDFNRHIRPILSNHCFHCHGPADDDRQADLRLDDRDDATRPRDSGRAVAPGNLAESLLWRRVSTADESERMPPADYGKPLSAEQVEWLRRWIESGAEWPEAWAYAPPVRSEPPAIENSQWPSNWVDHFVLARIERAGLRPSPPADRATLLRRLTFDLTGLPPTPAELDDFLADDAPDAYERAVDRLLASPRHGERMAMFWLDLVRYADTVGYHGDQDHSISPYRDYVIWSFIENKPFDEFTVEQLAGDLLPEPTMWQRVATGYNRVLQTSHEGGVQEKEYLAIYAADRMRNLSLVWMGGTLGCAQCHDHKYDPYTTRDFYAMSAFFADIDETDHLRRGDNRLPTRRSPEMRVHTPEQQAEIERLRERVAQLERASADTGGAPAEAPTEDDLKQARERLAAAENAGRLTMITAAVEPRVTRVLPRGNWLDESGPIVEPAIPEFLGSLDTGDRRATRLDLARWLVAPDGYGPMTARVMANRFWALMFGAGISPSLDDFGGQGRPPDHPELLDALAVEFLESGWNVKHVLKLLAMSSAYRQSSLVDSELRQHDPANRLFARQARYRLPAEMIRDAALAASGLLVEEVGGESVRPYQPAGYYQHLNFPRRAYSHHADRRQWRRGVYVHWQRQFLHPMLKAFDAPSREECAAERARSNTPLAALTLLNDPTFVEAARALAERALVEGGENDDQRLDHACRLALSRPPDEFERRALLALLDASRDAYSAEPARAQQLLEVGLFRHDASLSPVDLAAWTSLARALFNLNECITRN